MTRPYIQIDDEVREMTEEEYAQYLVSIAQIPPLEGEDETPTAN